MYDLDLESCHPVQLYHLGAPTAFVYAGREVLVPTEVGFCLLAGVRLPGLGDGNHAKLIFLTETELNMITND